MAVAKTVQSVLKTHGLSRTIPAAVRAELIAHAPLASPVADFQARLLEHVDREAAKLPEGVTWLASSDIIESVRDGHAAQQVRGRTCARGSACWSPAPAPCRTAPTAASAARPACR